VTEDTGAPEGTPPGGSEEEQPAADGDDED
jgi:hypothetical protein